MSFFQKLKAGLTKTKEGMFKNLDGLFGGHKIEEEFYEELEEILIMSDVGAAVSDKIVTELRQKVKEVGCKETSEAKELLKEIIVGMMQGGEALLQAQGAEIYAVDVLQLLLELPRLIMNMIDDVLGQFISAAAEAAARQTFHEEIIARADGAGEIRKLYLGHQGKTVLMDDAHGGDFSLHHVDFVGEQARDIFCSDLQHGGAVRKVHPVGSVTHALGQFGDGLYFPPGESGGTHAAQGFGALVVLGDGHKRLLNDDKNSIL